VKSGHEVVGKALVTADTGERIGEVEDVLFDEQHNRVRGLVISHGRFSGKRTFVGFDGVQTIGPDVIIARGRSDIVLLEEREAASERSASNNSIKGKRVVTRDGRVLGSIRDLYFDERTGGVVGYEISDDGGLLRRGRSILPVSDEGLTVGEDVVVVSARAADLMKDKSEVLEQHRPPAE
jgi:uncharacterized protein YrrD